MIRRWLIGIIAATALAAAGWLATAIAQSPHVVKAIDPPDAEVNRWDPGIQDGPGDALDVEIGDTVSWQFDEARAPHDLWLKVPGEEQPIQLSIGCSDGQDQNPDWCYPDSDAIDYQFEEGAEEGTYVYFCTLHGGNPEGTSGMSGRIVLGDPGNGGPESLPNPTSVEPPWETGTEPPKLRNVLVRGVKRGVRLRARLTHPSKLVVRMRRRGKLVLTRRLRNLPEGVVRERIRSKRLRRGRYKVVIRGRDRWGVRTDPPVIRERIRVRY